MEICTTSNCYFLKAYLSQFVPWLTNGTELLQGIKYNNEDHGTHTYLPENIINYASSLFIRICSFEIFLRKK